MDIRLGHSPDADDAFMFFGLATGKVSSGPYRIVHKLEDIQTLNDRAGRGEYEITALSAHAYAYVADRYAITRCGGSFGDGYGPMIVAGEAVADRAEAAGCDLAGLRIAIPGRTTSAALALALYQKNLQTTIVPFDRIMPAVAAGEVDAGLIIHEGQLTYGQARLRCVLDLGKWWQQETRLPLPLGLNAIRRDLSASVQRDLETILLESIRYSLTHREEALAHALSFGRELQGQTQLADRFVGMYVNELTLDMGPRGRAAVELLLTRAHEEKIVPHPAKIAFACEA